VNAFGLENSASDPKRRMLWSDLPLPLVTGSLRRSQIRFPLTTGSQRTAGAFGAERTAERLSQPLQLREELKEIVGVQSACRRCDGVSAVTRRRARTYEAEPQQDAMHVAVDDEHAHPQRARIERRRRHFRTYSRQSFEPGKRLVNRAAAKEGEIVIGALPADPAQGGDEPDRLVPRMVNGCDNQPHRLRVRRRQLFRVRPALLQAFERRLGDPVVSLGSDQRTHQLPYRIAPSELHKSPERLRQSLAQEGQILSGEIERLLHQPRIEQKENFWKISEAVR